MCPRGVAIDCANNNHYHSSMNAIPCFAPRLLVIEDDAVLGRHLEEFLTDRQYSVTLCNEGPRGLAEAGSGAYQMVLLDILLPGLNGLELLAELRKVSPVPVIVVSALGDEQARIQGLISGADDYLPKPFSMAELGVRIDAVLRRVNLERQTSIELRAENPEPGVQSGALALSDHEESAAFHGQDMGLTSTEYRLLKILVEHGDQVLSKPFLYQTVLYRGCGRHDRSLDLHVSHLRRKLRAAGVPDSPLRTVWGQGYTLESRYFL